MKIDKADTRTNFNGFYRIPYSDANMMLVRDVIMPGYKKVTGENALAFKGDFPFAYKLDEFIGNIAKRYGASPEWLKINSKKYNINVPDTNFITIISSNKDVDEFVSLNKKIKRKHYGLIGKIKYDFFKFKTILMLNDLPIQSVLTLHAIKPFEGEQKMFSRFMSSKNVKEIPSVEKLLIEMLRDKK